MNGNKVLEIRYKAWGEVRATWTSSPSTTPAYKMPLYQYTSQASYMDDPLTSGVTEGFGLMFYQSRFYDPQLSRFTQADTIIPESTQGTQAWDRYAFVNNNPVRYTDPTGHSVSALTWTLIGVTVAIAVAAVVVFAAPAVVATLAVAAAATPGVGIGVVSALATASFAPGAALTALGVAGTVTGALLAVSAAHDTNVDSAAQSAVNATQSSVNATVSSVNATQSSVNATLSAPSATATPTTTPIATSTPTLAPTSAMEVQIVPDTPTPCGRYGQPICH